MSSESFALGGDHGRRTDVARNNGDSLMHVLRLSPHLYWPQLPESGWPVRFDCMGGLHTQVTRQTLALAQLGVRQTVVTLKVPGAPAHWTIDERTQVRGVRVSLLPFPSRATGLIDLNASWAAGVARELWRRSTAADVDVVHVHSNGSPWPLLLANALSHRLAARMVVTLHCSNLVNYRATRLADLAIVPLRRRLERQALRSADHVVVLSPNVRDFYVQAGHVDPRRISVVPDSVDVQRFRGLADAGAQAGFRKRFRLGDEEIVTFVGRIAREKGWDRLLDVAERLAHRRARFVVCGDGLERDLMEAELRRRGLVERFVITGFLAPEQVPAAIAASAVVVLPSRYEEFGGVLMEALAVGTPTVAFAVGGVPNTLANGASGFAVPAGDIGAMGRAVERLLDEPELVERFARAGLRDVRDRFELGRAASGLLDVYRMVSNGDGRSRAE